MVHGRKKKETRLRGNLDRLSELPDSLILQILSSLEMKDVVKTGILSKRWQNLWTQVHNLVYDFNVVGEEHITSNQYRVSREQQLEQFVSFITTTLRQHDSNIKMFSLNAFWADYFDDEEMNVIMDSWIECVLVKRVEALEIDFDGLLYYAPDLLFQSSSLTKLKLENLMFREPLLSVKWNLLKFLCLTNMSLEDESMENILSGCLVLESLSLEMIDDLTGINIMSPSVRKLELVDILEGGNVDTTFKIRAPWLQELEISGTFLVANCQIEDVSSLVKATLAFTAYETTFSDEEDDALIVFNVKWINDMVPHLLKALSHVAELSIGTELIQVLSLAKLYGKPSPSFQCKLMTINSPLWNYDVLGIACLLENTPHLETLIINVSNYQFKRPLDQSRPFDDEDMNLNLPNGNLVHLKYVKIDYERNQCTDNPEYVGGKCNDMELVKYIMRSVGHVLERLVLCSSKPGCTFSRGCSKANCSFEYVPRLCSELSNFLPGNEADEWELKKRNFFYEYEFSNCAFLGSEVASEGGL